MVSDPTPSGGDAPVHIQSGVPALRQSYRAAVPELSVPWRADSPPAPRLVVVNEDLSRELGMDPELLRTDEGLALLSGQIGTGDTPITTAQAYAGFQFGSPSPILGDGRALLLGDLETPDGEVVDVHLKGTGRTPFSRAGDGKAPLGPMLREHLIAEALHALGIPTSRALAVVATGEDVRRRSPRPEPGAILARVAASHLRVGTFQYAAWHHDLGVRRALLDYAIARHHPAARDAENPALALLEAVTVAQAELIAAWMSVGFVHSVMNTDNMTISGQSIDFGPCAFLDVHRTDAVFSSIDTQGRYAYGQQPGIALWNLSRYAEALLELIDETDPDAAVTAATAVLEGFEPAYHRAWTARMAEKLGIPGGAEESAEAEVAALAADTVALMERAGADHTGFFRALAEGRITDLGLLADDVGPWLERLDAVRTRAADGTANPQAALERARHRMGAVNPIYIPRNHHLQRALDAAEDGDMTAYQRLLSAVRAPFTRRDGWEDLTGPGDAPGPFVTYCGT